MKAMQNSKVGVTLALINCGYKIRRYTVIFKMAAFLYDRLVTHTEMLIHLALLS